ncbi:uncharacterized protein [Pyrus communis]|uniref:uncharacterized protein n=1 Tax=Pyrus communis TaxID=23211 RepID=UPI0035C2623D
MTTLSTLFRLHTPPSNPPLSHASPHPLRLSCSFKPTKPPKPPSLSASTPPPPPARDRVIDFGKHKGKMLGTLPSAYLKWVSKNLRARDFEDWAKLADQVLDDAVYRDRIEWEVAENILNGNRRNSIAAGGVSELLEISERFGWDNEDKIGWSRVNFELLGTSKGGRIPRRSEKEGGERGEEREEEKEVVEDLGEVGERRRERRVRVRQRMRREDKLGIFEKSGGSVRNGVGLGREKESDGEDWMVENSKRFPGREGLLKMAYSRRMGRFL